MDYNKGAVDLASGKIDISVQLTQDGKSVELTGQTALKKKENKNRQGRVNRISYSESDN